MEITHSPSEGGGDPDEFDHENSAARVEQYLAQAVADGDATPSDVEIDAQSYVAQIQRQLDAEVSELRALGKYPPSLLARVKKYYATLLPPGSSTTARDFDTAFKLTDRVAYIDIDVPTASKKPGVAFVKRSLRMLMAWYLNYVAQQFNNFSSNLIRLLGIIDARISRLEERFEATAIEPLGLMATTSSIDAQLEMSADVVKILAGTKGRILVAECATGQIIEALCEAGLDAYGIDTRSRYLDHLELQNIEVRNAGTIEHLAKIGQSSLQALVLSGITDRSSNSDRIAALFQAKRVLAQGATLLVVCAGEDAFARVENHLERDLSPGRPYSPQTWLAVADFLTFANVEILPHETSGSFLVLATNTKIAPLLDGFDAVKTIGNAASPQWRR